ncbi:MAG: hypothetical protein PHO15_06040 [Eubacteriales bacterium]|nr:hypothetical protein [Eubacteriales bacterium]
MSVFYKMKDLNTVAKQERDTPYIYDKETEEWKEDDSGLFEKRLNEFDGSGGALEEISEEEAMDLLRRYDGEM